MKPIKIATLLLPTFFAFSSSSYAAYSGYNCYFAGHDAWGDPMFTAEYYDNGSLVDFATSDSCAAAIVHINGRMTNKQNGRIQSQKQTYKITGTDAGKRENNKQLKQSRTKKSTIFSQLSKRKQR